MRSLIAAAVLAGLLTLSAAASAKDRFLPGGPYYLRGTDMIACKRPDAVVPFSDPDAPSRFGRHNFILLFAEYGCVDVPDGVLVDVISAGRTIALILPHAPVSSVFFVLRDSIVNADGLPIPASSTQ